MELTTLIERCESQSEETKKGRGWVKGMPKSEAHKRKIAESLKGKMTGPHHPSFGKPKSEESKKKQSESLKIMYARRKTDEVPLDRKMKLGYVLIKADGHPKSSKLRLGNFIYEHILVMEKHLGRYLEPYESVRHINKIRSDNRIENLELWPPTETEIMREAKSVGVGGVHLMLPKRWLGKTVRCVLVERGDKK
jgi:hypothetical protein